MKLANKIRKLVNGHAYGSALATMKRWTYPLGKRPFIDAVDPKGFAEICERYRDLPRDSAPGKYLDIETWMHKNVKRVQDLRLKPAPPRMRVLDLGSGTGYFLHIAKCMGHDVLGIDIDAQPVYGEIFELLGIERHIYAIQPYERLPDLGEPFGLITAHMTCFNRHTPKKHWEIPEWRFFLDDLETRLTDTGRIQFDLNTLPDGRPMENDLRAYFIQRGASVDRGKVYFPPKNQLPKGTHAA